MSKPQVTIWTDGGAEPNPGKGGYGAVIIFTDANGKQHRKEIYGGRKYATNNQMELLAAIEGLKSLTKPCTVTLYSDSQYLIYTMTKNWNRGKNRELWYEIDQLCAVHDVNWQWVRGHNGTPDNERAHDLSVQGMKNEDGA